MYAPVPMHRTPTWLKHNDLAKRGCLGGRRGERVCAGRRFWQLDVHILFRGSEPQKQAISHRWYFITCSQPEEESDFWHKCFFRNEEKEKFRLFLAVTRLAPHTFNPAGLDLPQPDCRHRSQRAFTWSCGIIQGAPPVFAFRRASCPNSIKQSLRSHACFPSFYECTIIILFMETGHLHVQMTHRKYSFA